MAKKARKKRYLSRADRLSEAESMVLGLDINEDSTEEEIEAAKSIVENARSIVEELNEELDSWKSNLEGTNLENTNKYQMLEEACSRLEEIDDALNISDVDPDEFEDLQSIDWSVDFPGMFD